MENSLLRGMLRSGIIHAYNQMLIRSNTTIGRVPNHPIQETRPSTHARPSIGVCPATTVETVDLEERASYLIRFPARTWNQILYGPYVLWINSMLEHSSYRLPYTRNYCRLLCD